MLQASGPVACVPQDKNGDNFSVIELHEGDRLRLKIPAVLASLEMVRIPKGTIEMPLVANDGKIDPARTQVVPIRSFWMATTETTWDIYHGFYWERGGVERAAAADGLATPSMKPYSRPDGEYGTGGYAAINMTSRHARLFCTWLRLKTGRNYRLPTEAEWEYACRAGGAALSLSEKFLLRVAWVEENSEEAPHPVATKPANAWGLHDMLGNVGEWALGIDGVWVQKGGSWFNPAERAKFSFRAPLHPDWQIRDPMDPKHELWLSDGFHVGFRIVREE